MLCIENRETFIKKISFNSLNFVDINSEEGFKQRLFYILDTKENLQLQKKVNIAVICGCFIWMLSSYYFILQPRYSPDEEIQKLENQEDQVFDGTNTYIEKRKDGSYILHFGSAIEDISKNDIEKGFYKSYPIVDEK